VKKSNLKVALVHDFLREYGGGERVLEALHELFPQAPVYVAFVDKKALGSHWRRFEDWDIRSTWFSKIPFHKRLFSPLRFLAPHAFAALDLSEFDLVISSTNAFEAKAVRVPNGKHLCYCHTPPRALYGYSTMSAWKKNPIIKFFGELINHYMRVVDFKHAQKVNQFIANGEETQERIKKFYRRKSVVIYPPVQLALAESELEKIKEKSEQDYYLFVNRLGLQKHPELALEVCLKLKKKLKIVGVGPMLEDLKEMANGSNLIEFMGAVDDKQLAQLYAGAKALLYPVEDEDFGMVPIEAMMAGTPVIAHNSGGPRYTVVPGENGVLFEGLSLEGLEEAVKKFEKMSFNPKKVSLTTETYTGKEFEQRMKKIILKLSSETE